MKDRDGGRKKVREERQRGKRNKEEWKIEREGRNRGWRGWEGRKKKVFGTEREGSQRGMGDREGRKKEIEWRQRIQGIKVGELECEVDQRRKRDRQCKKKESEEDIEGREIEGVQDLRSCCCFIMQIIV